MVTIQVPINPPLEVSITALKVSSISRIMSSVILIEKHFVLPTASLGLKVTADSIMV